jgi:hypothetical protein
VQSAHMSWFGWLASQCFDLHQSAQRMSSVPPPHIPHV